jgi:hypothetical protein
MIATVINCLAVIIGSLLGLLLVERISEKYRSAIFDGAGIATVVIGVSMALESKRIIFLALSLIAGGLLGTLWDIDGAILRFGRFLERLTLGRGKKERPRAINGNTEQGAAAWDFGHGFLNASVLYCVGAMALIGSFRAGTQGDYTLLLTKSVLDGSMAILLAAAMGPGVAFSALPILVYQGILTIAAVYIKPYVSPLIISELTGIGGAMILMIALNLLSLKTIKTANFLPSLVIIVLFAALDPLFAQVAKQWGM